MNEAAEPARGAPLVGREAELTLLTAALRDVQRGSGRIVLLSGEAGLGKSRLVREVAALVRAASGRAIFGAAYTDAAGRPFSPIIDALRDLQAGAPGSAREIATSAVAALAPDADGGRADAGLSRWSQVDAIADALMAGTGTLPPLRLLVIEDLHWADASTLELLAQVLRRLEQTPMLAVATFRPPSPDADALITFADSIRQLHHSERIELGPIAPGAGAELVRASVGTTAGEVEVAAIVARCEGNPFFLEEAARDAARAAREGLAPPAVPAAVRELVQRRASAMPPDARDAAAALAVIGESSDPTRIASLLGAPVGAVAAAIDTLVADGLLVPQPGGVGFRHALARDAVYEWLPVSRRRELHERCARLIEAEQGERGAAAIARHLERVGGREHEGRAGALLALAGEQSLAQLAYEQAAEQLASAIRLLENSGAHAEAIRRARLYLAEAMALTRADDRALDAFATLADEAADAGDFEREAEAAVGYERTFVVTGRPRTGADARSIALLDRAAAHLEARGPLGSLGARTIAASAQARLFIGQREQALALSARAIEVAQASGDAAAEAAALNTQRAASWGPDQAEERLRLTQTIVGRAAASRQADLELEGLYWQVSVLLECGLRQDAEAAIARFGTIAQRLRRPNRLSEFHRMRAMIAHLSGDVAGARPEVAAALRSAREAGNAEASLYYTAQMAVVAPEGERRSAIADGIAVLLPTVTARHADPWVWARRMMLAYLHACGGDRARAASLVEILVEAGLERIPRDHMWLPTMALLTEVVCEVGTPVWADLAYVQLAPYADRYIVNSNAVCYGSVERLLGRLATIIGSPAATEHRQRARERNEAIGADVWLEPDAAPSASVKKTFMFTDIVKSTNLVEAMGDEAWEVLLRWHNQTLGTLFREHQGEEVVSTGDGFFVAFETADAAIDCALAIQRRLAEHRQSSGFAPQVRIGLHASEATAADHNYHGKGVHEAARISALAEGGEVIASTATAGSRRTLGPPRTVALKGIAEPVELVALAWR